jgi:hypothetical protein
MNAYMNKYACKYIICICDSLIIGKFGSRSLEESDVIRGLLLSQ